MLLYYENSFIGTYFNVETDDILKKIASSFIPINRSIAQSNPDLYGPFWIITTLIVFVIITGNLSRYASVIILIKINIKYLIDIKYLDRR